MESVHEQVRMKIPAEAVELYTRYIHGEVSRRDFLRGVKRFAIAGLSAEALVQALMPNYALGQQVRKDDERIKASYETIPSPNGNGYIRGYFVRPFSQDSRAETPTKLGVIPTTTTGAASYLARSIPAKGFRISSHPRNG